MRCAQRQGTGASRNHKDAPAGRELGRTENKVMLDASNRTCCGVTAADSMPVTFAAVVRRSSSSLLLRAEACTTGTAWWLPQLWDALEKRLDRELADGATSTGSGSGDGDASDSSSEDDYSGSSGGGRGGGEAAPQQEQQPAAGFQLFGCEPRAI